MVSPGDTAPNLSATIATSEHEPFELSEYLGEGPVVLAFFPAAFAPTCSNEVVAIEDRIDAFEAADATVFGICSDSAYALAAFKAEYDISYDLISEMKGDGLAAYGVETDIPEMGRYGIANRAVFVLDDDGTVVYKWIAEELAHEPDYEAVLEAVKEA